MRLPNFDKFSNAYKNFYYYLNKKDIVIARMILKEWIAKSRSLSNRLEKMKKDLDKLTSGEMKKI
jgi:hypothetical protein